MRLPRPCRFLARRFILASKFGIGKTLPCDLAHGKREAISIIQRVVFSSTIVKPKHLLSNVAIKMKRLNSNVGSTKPALQQRPEVLYALRVNLAAHILFNMVNSRVNVILSRDFLIGREAIRVERCPVFISNLIE